MKKLVFCSTVALVAALGMAPMARASSITVLASRGLITETDFIDWQAVADVHPFPPGTVTPASGVTNAGNSFTFAQPTTNPSNCQGSGSCLRYGVFSSVFSTTGIDLSGFQDFQPITLTFNAGNYDMVGFNGMATRNTTFFLQVTHGGVTDAPIQINLSAATGPIFLGVSSTANDITKVIMSVSGGLTTGNGDSTGVDRVSLHTTSDDPGPTATPEPSTLALLGVGGAFVAFFRRRATIA